MFLLPNPSDLIMKATIVGCLAIGLFLVGFKTGHFYVTSKWNEEKLVQAEAYQKKLEENNSLIVDLEKQRESNMQTIQQSLVDLRTIRVRVPSCTPQIITAPASSSEPDTAAASAFYKSAQEAFDLFRTRLESDAHEADRIIEGCRVMQDWILEKTADGK